MQNFLSNILHMSKLYAECSQCVQNVLSRIHKSKISCWVFVLWRFCFLCRGGSRTFRRRGRQLLGGAPTQYIYTFSKKKTMKLKKFWSAGEGGRAPGAPPPLNPPLLCIWLVICRIFFRTFCAHWEHSAYIFIFCTLFISWKFQASKCTVSVI